MPLYPVSINDIDLATAKQIVPTDVYLFLRWVITNDDVEADLESSCSIPVSWKSRIEDWGSRIEDQGSRIKDQGSMIE